MAKDYIFSTPSSIIAHPDGTILLANSGSKQILQIKSISSYEDDQKYLNIFSSEMNEIYLFNRIGQHRATIDALTGDYIYNFTYDSPQNVYARLDSITHRNGKSLTIKYDYAMKINDIYLPNGNKLKMQFSKQKLLSSITDNDGLSTQFIYDNGLLISILENNVAKINFNYDKSGRLQKVIHQDGFYNEFLIMTNHSYMTLIVQNPDGNSSYLMNDSSIIQIQNDQQLVRRYIDSNSIVYSTNTEEKLYYKTNQYPILTTDYPAQVQYDFRLNSNITFTTDIVYSSPKSFTHDQLLLYENVDNKNQLRIWNLK
ncbi:unnamed protein product, partial [Didymodactylos carnosus]